MENSFVHDGNGDVDVELWRACAGPLVTIPHVGDVVYYFPQGHLEQVEAYTNQGTNLHIPKYNLPSEILCRVVNVHLKAEPETDEVFAQLTLLPETKQNELSLEEGNVQNPCQRTNVYSFCKTLTTSDTSTHGGFSVLKRHVDKCLPPLDMSQQPPSQELVAKDLHGVEWHFRHIYRGQPKRHLLTSGWSTFVSSKKLVAGDAFIFLRGEENGELRVGVRRAKKLQKNASASVLSSHSMQLGILATASHAISTGTMFTVYYQPRSSPSEFIIPYDMYMKAIKNDYSVGMRFTMKFEGEECQEQRFAGKIMGVEDVDPVRWPGSKWKFLLAKWDDSSAAVIRPDRVSPWKIELDGGMNVRQPPIVLRSKRACIRNPSSSSSEPYISANDGLSGSIEPAPLPPRQPGVLQGQEIKSANVHELENTKKSCWVPPKRSDYGETKIEEENQLRYWFPLCPTNMTTKNIGLNESSYLDTGFSIHAMNEKSGLEAMKIDAATAGKNCVGTCMLFGVDLVKSPLEPATLPATTSSEPCYHTTTPAPVALHLDITDSAQVAFEQTKNPMSLSGSCGISRPCKDSSALISRSCTKVHKYGTALGRSVDLSRFNGYEELLSELDRIFDFGGELLDPNNTWNVIYTDDEGDIMLVGDYPWPEFILMVRRMYIWPKGEEDKLKTCSSNTLP
ncbi:hypothetical protein Sjap_007610 [Stephania japonica]|uniref:Auxin response factor n=1 Tax=Stephania japonica TaxID=461633 RepID=A0AAP0JMX7_9MAGN